MNFPEWLSRSELLLGQENLSKLKDSHVLIVGLGGVGAYAAENICRAGVGSLTIVDGDTVHPSNINRQLIGMHSTIGISKVNLIAGRLLDINPDLNLTSISEYITDVGMADLIKPGYSYVVDAIDTLSPKYNLILKSLEKQIPIISSMGAGGKKDPTLVKVTDISKSYNCNLARVLRKKLHRNGIYKGFKVVFSSEETDNEAILPEEGQNKKSIVGTISYMPAIFGCVCASVVIRDLINAKE